MRGRALGWTLSGPAGVFHASEAAGIFLRSSAAFETARQPQTLFLGPNARASQVLATQLSAGYSYRVRVYVTWRRDKLQFPFLHIAARARSTTGVTLAAAVVGPADVLQPAQGTFVAVDVFFTPPAIVNGQRLVLDIRSVGGTGQANIDALSVAIAPAGSAVLATLGDPWDGATTSAVPTMADTTSPVPPTTVEPDTPTTAAGGAPGVAGCVVNTEYTLTPSGLAMPLVSFFPSRGSWQVVEVRWDCVDLEWKAARREKSGREKEKILSTLNPAARTRA